MVDIGPVDAESLRRAMAEHEREARERQSRRVRLATMIVGWLISSMLLLVFCTFGVWLISDGLGLALSVDRVIEVSVGLLVASASVVTYNRPDTNGNNGSNGK